VLGRAALMLFELWHSDKPMLRARSDAVRTLRFWEMGRFRRARAREAEKADSSAT